MTDASLFLFSPEAVRAWYASPDSALASPETKEWVALQALYWALWSEKHAAPECTAAEFVPGDGDDGFEAAVRAGHWNVYCQGSAVSTPVKQCSPALRAMLTRWQGHVLEFVQQYPEPALDVLGVLGDVELREEGVFAECLLGSAWRAAFRSQSLERALAASAPDTPARFRL